MSRSAMSWMCSRSLRTCAGLNAAPASSRSRVCAGASRKSICLTMTLAIGATSGAPRASKYSGVGVRSAENVVGR